jgi:hypothetical protein
VTTRHSTLPVPSPLPSCLARIAIEEDYARRLSKLGRSQGALLGKDEEGQLKEALETLGRETDGLGESHRHLASEMKSTLEVCTPFLKSLRVTARRPVRIAASSASKELGRRQGEAADDLSD